MASVYKYTIIYFTLVIQESMSISIKRNLCLETVERFINHEDKCSFDLDTAKYILQDVTTCPKRCSFTMNNLNRNNRNSLRKIDLTISNEQTEFYPCLRSAGYRRTLLIDCSSWNEIMVNIGGNCKFNWQCKGTEFANVCDQGICSCSQGYMQIDRKCYQENLQLNDSCELTEQCIQSFSVCFQRKCECIDGFSAFDTDRCLKDTVPVGGFCSLHEQCTGSNNSGICDNGRCTCTKGFTIIGFACKNSKENLQLNDSCELTEQCIQPFSVCFQGKCECMDGFSAFDTDRCLKDNVPVGGFCSLHKQCTGSNNSGICEHGRCTCAKEFIFIDLACEKKHQSSFESSQSQEQDTNIGVTLGTLFGGFILGAIVTAVVTTLIYRRLKFQTRKREEPDVMFADNRTYDGAGSVDSDAQISCINDKKQKMATEYAFSKETPGYNLSGKEGNEKTEDVYNHLNEQTDRDDDTCMCGAQSQYISL